MENSNMWIRNNVKKAGSYIWGIETKMRVDDRNFSRKLREELLAEQKASIAVIARPSADGGDANE